MVGNQVTLVLFYGEIWKSLSAALPLQAAMSRRNADTSSASEDRAPPHPRQETGLILAKAGVTAAAPFPEASPEPSDSSWVAALIIGIILTSMLIAILIIVLWKCCKRPVPADSNWAGRSPFADGDTPDVFMDPDQPTKRSSVLFMLPWKLKQDTNSQQDPTAPEKPPSCSGASAPRPSADPLPCSEPPTGAPSSEPLTGVPCSEPLTGAPTSEPLTGAPSSCAALVAPESPDLPPPPDWLRDPAEDHGPEPSEGQECHSGPEEPLPPPPESPSQEMHEPPPQLPQPQLPL
ncbi:protein EVI2B [Patagioenas fasciata]|uniref:Protein EVI2B n=1 Tax=Patagioenas fasciata monilis TaxID=372326 RepID=A0A1V4K239_PATFA|nr:protein EVI2B [Patagioenas fasciata monilis]